MDALAQLIVNGIVLLVLLAAFGTVMALIRVVDFLAHWNGTTKFFDNMRRSFFR